MKPTDILSSEHRVIEQVLDCLEAMVREAKRRAGSSGSRPRTPWRFFRNFADRCHHGKEEAHLFPAMEAKGFPRDGGPTGVMLHEHEQGRAHVRGMDEAIDAAAAGDAAALRQFVEHAEGYVALLREHIYKEDHILFQLADRTLERSRSTGAVGRVRQGGGGGDGCRHAREVPAIRQGIGQAIRRAGRRPFTPRRPFHCGHGRMRTSACRGGSACYKLAWRSGTLICQDAPYKGARSWALQDFATGPSWRSSSAWPSCWSAATSPRTGAADPRAGRQRRNDADRPRRRSSAARTSTSATG